MATQNQSYSAAGQDPAVGRTNSCLSEPSGGHGTCRPHSKHKRAVSGNISRCITRDHPSACRDIPSC